MTIAASGTVKKVIEINPYLLGTMAGGAGAFDLREYNLRYSDVCLGFLVQPIVNTGRHTLAFIVDCTNSAIVNVYRCPPPANI